MCAEMDLACVLHASAALYRKVQPSTCKSASTAVAVVQYTEVALACTI
jgi:hypothetical protein